MKHICIEDKFILRLTVNPQIALTQFQNNTAVIGTPDLYSMSPRSHRKQVLGQHAILKITWPQWAINLSPRNGHMLLVCEYLWQVSTQHNMDVNKHLMIGPKENSEFCSSENLKSRKNCEESFALRRMAHKFFAVSRSTTWSRANR